MGKVAGISIIVLACLEVIWIGYKLFIENTPEFPNLILPIGLTTVAVVLIKWAKEPYPN
jgi:hypothetical protein